MIEMSERGPSLALLGIAFHNEKALLRELDRKKSVKK